MDAIIEESHGIQPDAATCVCGAGAHDLHVIELGRAVLLGVRELLSTSKLLLRKGKRREENVLQVVV